VLAAAATAKNEPYSRYAPGKIAVDNAKEVFGRNGGVGALGGGEPVYGARMPSRRPRSIAWVRLPTESFSKMLLTCFFTVCSEMKR
jgi:hypothetical protein